MKVLLVAVVLVSTVCGCGPSGQIRTIPISVHAFRVFDPKFVVTPKHSSEAVIRTLTAEVRRLIASFLGVQVNHQAVKALRLDLTPIKLLDCADILPLNDTVPAGQTNVAGFSYYCLQENGMIVGICRGTNCNRAGMEYFPEETIGWDFSATLNLAHPQARRTWNGKDIRDLNNYISVKASSNRMFKNVGINFS